jgi:hypothetical protein
MIESERDEAALGKRFGKRAARLFFHARQRARGHHCREGVPFGQKKAAHDTVAAATEFKRLAHWSPPMPGFHVLRHSSLANS